MTHSRFGSISKQPNGTFRAYATIGGKRVSRRGFETKADAVSWLALQRVTDAPHTATTFSEYWQAVVEPSLERLAPKTAHEYRRIWKGTLEPILGVLVASSIDRATVQRAMDTIESPSAQRHTHAVLRKICRMAMRDGVIQSDPTIGITLHKAARRPREVMDVANLDSWLTLVHGYRHEARMLLMLGCGLSVSEAYAVDMLRDVEGLDGGRVAVSVSKTLVDVGGHAVLNGTAKTEFRERTVVLGHPFATVFESALPAPSLTSPSSASRSWREWQLRRGVEKPSAPSDLRPTFACWCAEAGLSDSLIAKAMGHAGNTTAARHYQRATLRSMTLVADALAAYCADFAPL